MCALQGQHAARTEVNFMLANDGVPANFCANKDLIDDKRYSGCRYMFGASPCNNFEVTANTKSVVVFENIPAATRRIRLKITTK
jgi:hypothetical protein